MSDEAWQPAAVAQRGMSRRSTSLLVLVRVRKKKQRKAAVRSGSRPRASAQGMRASRSVRAERPSGMRAGRAQAKRGQVQPQHRASAISQGCDPVGRGHVKRQQRRCGCLSSAGRCKQRNQKDAVSRATVGRVRRGREEQDAKGRETAADGGGMAGVR